MALGSIAEELFPMASEELDNARAGRPYPVSLDEHATLLDRSKSAYRTLMRTTFEQLYDPSDTNGLAKAIAALGETMSEIPRNAPAAGDTYLNEHRNGDR